MTQISLLTSCKDFLWMLDNQKSLLRLTMFFPLACSTLLSFCFLLASPVMQSSANVCKEKRDKSYCSTRVPHVTEADNKDRRDCCIKNLMLVIFLISLLAGSLDKWQH